MFGLRIEDEFCKHAHVFIPSEKPIKCLSVPIFRLRTYFDQMFQKPRNGKKSCKSSEIEKGKKNVFRRKYRIISPKSSKTFETKDLFQKKVGISNVE